MDRYWLEINCTDCETIKSEVVELTVYKFKRILPDRTVKQFASVMDNYSTILKNVKVCLDESMVSLEV